ncbi:LLM class flavin-dependent oxidoreductase [Kineococcus terrestris]|uniref:LLM class flavin-dependent oxidoreductase n=1 Tax=Kineococcus terrestris TaxID=2044856 RepID=UPI0034DB18DD
MTEDAAPRGTAVDVVLWPDGPWPELRERWLLAERWGLRRGWLWDHLDLGGRPVWHDAWTVLAAAAATTSRIGLGTMVTSPNFRHPVTAAKAALALDAVSGGRFVLGVGAGGPGVDSDALGGGPWTPAERAERFREWVELGDDLLSRDRVTSSGRWFGARDVALGGGPSRRVPLAVAATGPRGLALAAARADLWITQDVARAGRTAWEEVRRQSAALDEACARSGREAGSLSRLVVLGYGDERPLDSVEAFRDAAGRYAALGFGTVAVLWPTGARSRERLAVLEDVAARG